jgi:hypothetical protein
VVLSIHCQLMLSFTHIDDMMQMCPLPVNSAVVLIYSSLYILDSYICPQYNALSQITLSAYKIDWLQTEALFLVFSLCRKVRTVSLKRHFA